MKIINFKYAFRSALTVIIPILLISMTSYASLPDKFTDEIGEIAVCSISGSFDTENLELAVDGNSDTVLNAELNALSNDFVILDFGKVYLVDRLDTEWVIKSKNFTYFDVYVSDTGEENSWLQVARNRTDGVWTLAESDKHYVLENNFNGGVYARYLKIRTASANNDSNIGIAEIKAYGAFNGCYSLTHKNRYTSVKADIHANAESAQNGKPEYILNGNCETVDGGYYGTIYSGGFGLNNYVWGFVVDLGDVYNLNSVYFKWFYRLARENPETEGLEYEIMYSDTYDGVSTDNFRTFAGGSEAENSVIRWAYHSSSANIDKPEGFSVTANHTQEEAYGRYVCVKVTFTGKRIGGWADTGVYEMFIYGNHKFSSEYEECTAQANFYNNEELTHPISSLDGETDLYADVSAEYFSKEPVYVIAVYESKDGFENLYCEPYGNAVHISSDKFREGDTVSVWLTDENYSAVSDISTIYCKAPVYIYMPPANENLSGGWITAGIEDDFISAYITLPEAFAGRLVTVRMFKEGDDFTQSSLAKAVRLGEDGCAEAAFQTNAASGIYCLAFNMAGLDDIYEDRCKISIDFINSVRVKKAIKNLLDASYGENSGFLLESLISDKNVVESLNLDLTLFNETKSKDIVTKNAAEFMKRINETYSIIDGEGNFYDENYDKLDTVDFCQSFLSVINKYSLITAVNECEDGLAVKKLTGRYSDFFSDDEYINLTGIAAYNDIFAKWTDDMQCNALQRVCGRDFKEAGEILSAVQEAVLLSGIEQAEYWYDVKLISEQIAQIIGIPTYEISDKLAPSIYKKLMKNSYISYEEVKADEKKWFEYYSNTNENTQSKSSSSGGSRSSGNVSISKTDITQSGEAAKSAVFSDLSGYEWAEPMIEALYEKGIVSGVTKTEFKPEQYVKREEIVKMLVCMFDVKPLQIREVFDDVPSDDWSYPYIYAAYEANLVKGISSVQFGRGINITRQDLAVMCANFIKAYGLEKECNSDEYFSDYYNIAEYAKDAVNLLKGMGIINGRENNRFEPEKNATRAESAKIICGILALAER